MYNTYMRGLIKNTRYKSFFFKKKIFRTRKYTEYHLVFCSVLKITPSFDLNPCWLAYPSSILSLVICFLLGYLKIEIEINIKKLNIVKY